MAVTVGRGASAFAASVDPDEGLLDMSLEELLQVEVTSVSKREQSISDIAAAVTVITAEDIRRSGVRNIPEALRLAPGIDVARINGGTWAVSSRGFNGRFANKLLVLIDGRSVYSPLFAGTFWDTQTTLMEDIERIEVVRGPGAAIWGPNATNGVINIITRSALETEGPGLVAEVSDAGDYRVGARFSAQLSNSLGVRFGMLTEETSELRFASPDTFGGMSPSDDYGRKNGFLQVDWKPADTDHVSVDFQITDAERSELVLTSFAPNEAPILLDDAGDILAWSAHAQWDRETGTTGFRLAGSYERTERSELGADIVIDSANLSVDLRRQLGEGRSLAGGFYYQYDDSIVEGERSPIAFVPPRRETEHYGAYLQGEFGLGDRIDLTVGSTFEDNDFTGFEYQPSVRTLWHVTDVHSVWGGASRSVRTPSRFDRDIQFVAEVIPAGTLFPGPLPAAVLISGNPEQPSERLWSYEIGYRGQVGDRVSFDLAGFVNHYDQLQTTQPGMPMPTVLRGVPVVELPIGVTSASEAEAVGAELTLNVVLSSDLRLKADYSYLDLDVDAPEGALVLGDGQTPQHIAAIRTHYDVTDRVQTDLAVSYRSEATGGALPVDGFFDISARLAWTPVDAVELSLIGQQLNDASRLEIVEPFGAAAPVENERRVFARALFGF